MTSQSRRSFAQSLSLTGLAFVGFKLTGCGPAAEVDTRVQGVDTVAVVETVTMYDMLMEAWSTLGSGRLGDTGNLKATQVQADRDLTLAYTQDGDGHTFTLTKADLRKLRKGDSIKVLTTEALGHRHEVRIDPKKNKVPGSTGIEMPIDPDATVPPPSTEKLFATLEEKDQPVLHVDGSAELDPASVEYCVAAKEKCDADPTQWRRMKEITLSDGQRFVSESGLVLDPTLSELPLSLRGKLKADGASLRQLFKFLKL